MSSKPFKSFQRRSGAIVTYYEREDGFLQRGPQSLACPVYGEQPWLLERYDGEIGRMVQRYPQVGDTVFVEGLGYGEVVYDLGAASLDFTILFRNGRLEDRHADHVQLVHHNIKARSKPDLEKRLVQTRTPVRSVEELDFETVRGHFRALEFGLQLPVERDFDLEALLSLHAEMFAIFTWGGRLREGDERLVVGRKDWPTPNPEELPELVEDLIGRINETRLAPSVFRATSA